MHYGNINHLCWSTYPNIFFYLRAFSDFSYEDFPSSLVHTIAGSFSWGHENLCDFMRYSMNGDGPGRLSSFARIEHRFGAVSQEGFAH